MKIAIIGTLADSKMLAPFNDPEWEIWVCSAGNAYGAMPRVTRWFEIHGVVDLKGPENADWNQKYFDWLKTQQFPVYMQEPNDLLPEARIFPRLAWLNRFGDWGRMAATSSVAWMIGFAIMEGADEIGIWGVDMQADSEAYTQQKTGCQIMLKLAHDAGVKVTIPLESCLATMPPLYGYAEATRMGRRLLVRELGLTNRLNEARANIEHWQRTFHEINGALQTTIYVRRTFVDGVVDAELDIEETLADLPSGHKAAAVHPKGTTVEFPDLRPVSIIRETDPHHMTVEKRNSGLLVPTAPMGEAV